MELGLDIHGVGLELTGPDRTIAELRRDFEYFALPEGRRAPAAPSRPIALALRDAPPARPGPIGWFRTPRYSFRDDGPVRRIAYPEGAEAEYDFRLNRGAVSCPDPERLRELGYLAVLSRAGEALDRRGLHRVHALGLERGGRGALVLLPSGAGKSSLALELLLLGREGLLSDDTPLVSRDLRLLAFPLRMGFAPSADLSAVPRQWLRVMSRRHHGLKRLVDLGFFRDRVRSGVPLARVLVGERRGAGTPRIEPAPAWRCAGALLAGLVAGAGVAQLSEYMLRPRPSEAAGLARIGLSRLALAWRIARECPAWRFAMGPDVRANALALSRFLAS